MEEVDAIIVHTLGSIGCDVEEIYSLHQFTTEFIVEGIARCLKVINNDLDIPYRLPPSMSARFRVGTSLANAVSELGYSGEVGYQTFLYSNESDIRRVFMFLIDKLPKDTAQTTEEALGSSAILQRTIAAEVSRCLKNPWSPPYCKNKGVCWRGQPTMFTREGCSGVHKHSASFISTAKGIADLAKPCSKQLRQYYQKHLSPVTCQPRKHCDVAASVLEENALQYNAQQEWDAEWNQAGLTSRLSPSEYKKWKSERINNRISNYIKESASHVDAAESGAKDFASFVSSISERAGSQPRTKGSRFTHTEKLQFRQEDEAAAAQMGVGEGTRASTEEDLQKTRQEEIDALQKQLHQLASGLDSVHIQMKKMSATKQQTEEQVVELDKETKEKQESHLVRKRTLDLLPDAENNIPKLQGLVDGSAQRLVNLANQWEKHRVGLIEQIRELKDVSQTHAVEIAKTLEGIKAMRENMKGIATDIKSKEEMQKHLIAEYGRMTKDVNRPAYTRKIMEIVANIKKQNDEIGKVLIDTRGIQKEINQLSGKLDRTFAVTDELVFKDAKKDEAVRQAYKFLAALHENFNIVIKTVEDTGVIMREIRDLEDQIENEGKKKILSNLEKITADYQEMKKENQTLMSKLKKT